MHPYAHAYSTGLDRALSKLGYCSRSAAGKLIAGGQVQVNGKVVRNPVTPVRLGKDWITADGKTIHNSANVYLMINKPRGVVTTANDEKGRKTVYSLLADDQLWLAPVGRLDKASEGLLLLTNDSKWAAQITSPDSHIEKTYHVQIGVVADEALLDRLQAGVAEGGKLLKTRSVRILRHGKRNCWLEIVLDEGRNRHIRRMLAPCGVEVLRLVRVAIGPLELGDLPKAGTRELIRQEVQNITRRMA